MTTDVEMVRRSVERQAQFVQRLRQEATGIAASIVNGEVLLRDGKHTGALPGRLLRGPLAS